MKLLTVSLGGAIALLFQLAANAGPCDDYYAETISTGDANDPSVFSQLYNQDVEGGCLDIDNFYNFDESSERSLRDGALDTAALRKVISDLGAACDTVCQANAAPASGDGYVTALLGNTHAYMRDLTETGNLDSVHLDRNRWLVKARGGLTAANANLARWLASECAVRASDACRQAVSTSALLIRSGAVVNEMITSYQAKNIQTNDAFLTTRDKEWNEYFNTVSVQYPWELWWNSRRFKGEKDLDKFPQAPNDKVVFLHPVPGYEYIKAPDGRSVHDAVYVELIGYERWRWRDGKATRRWGGSVVFSYADITGMDSTAWGVLLHTPVRHISIGVVRRDGDLGAETGWVLNIDPAPLFKSYDFGGLLGFLKR